MKNQILTQLVNELKTECNRYTNGICQTNACLTRGGYKRGEKQNYETATCERHEQIKELEILLPKTMKTSKQLAEHYLNNLLGGRKGLNYKDIVQDTEIEKAIAKELEEFIEEIRDNEIDKFRQYNKE